MISGSEQIEQTRLSKAMKRVRDLSIGSPTLWSAIELIMARYGTDCWWEGYQTKADEAQQEIS